MISCSWGPTDGDWWDEKHPGHRATIPLPDNTRLAIEYALNNGRAGKGCVICWAAGNGNESVDSDGYAAHPGVIAVAACNDTGVRSVYSDTGKALWCAFPSGDSALRAVPALPNPPPIGGVWDADHAAAKTKGIWTTDWSGVQGYNAGGGSLAGDAAGNYTNGFGGTSSSAPGVAGVAALILSVNKKLRQEEVRDILKRSCDPIDSAHGRYDATTGHSPLYGYGRVNAAKSAALAAAPPDTRTAKRTLPTHRDAGETVGTLTVQLGESRLDGTLLARRGEPDPLAAATRFLDAKGLRSGRIAVTGAAGTLGNSPVIFMEDARRAGAADRNTFVGMGSDRAAPSPRLEKSSKSTVRARAKGGQTSRSASVKRRSVNRAPKKR